MEYDFKCHASDTLLLDRTEKKATRTVGDPLSDFLFAYYSENWEPISLPFW